MNWYTVSLKETEKKLETDLKYGLSEEEAGQRLITYGENKLSEKKKKSILKKFAGQFSDFCVIILFAAAVISFAVSLISGEGDYLDPVIILLIVIINAVIGVFQESRAESAIEALKKLSAPSARVLRNGSRVSVKASEIVPGDIVYLEGGDIVPADIRLSGAYDLFADESSLTGESEPTEKRAEGILPKDTPLGDRKNMLYMGSSISSGRGEGIAVETGMKTQMGEIAGMIHKEESDTPLQKKLAEIGKMLLYCALSICAVIFVLGVIRKKDILEMFIMSVSLAVAAIPEGLPAIVTIVLSLGVRRMADKKTIVRKLPAVEALGGVGVICCDKTGTLTENKMAVKKVFDMQSGEDGAMQGEILRFAALCCNCIQVRGKIVGEPTEAAIVNAYGGDINYLTEKNPRIKEIAFTSKRKMMTAVHRCDGRNIVITKGAPDFLLPKCSGAMYGDSALKLSFQDRKKIMKKCEEYAKDALRVLAVAIKETDNPAAVSEDNLFFLGLIAMQDPPKPKAKAAVETCKKAGIIPVMITGDHAETAKAVAKELSIAVRDSEIITGAELSEKEGEDFSKNILKYRVFARVSPEHKVKIVKAFQAGGSIVAMTGDGVNDAPALACADVGCAMGKSGTETAKSASDIIITDDDFSTIVDAVKEGRGIYQNIKRTIKFLLSCNIGEILTVLFFVLLNLPMPLAAIQLLFVNLITDSLPALALGAEPVRDNVMSFSPDSTKKFFSASMIYNMAVEGLLIGSLSVLAYALGRAFFDASPASPIIGRTMAFAVLSLSQIAHSFNMRSSDSIFKTGLLSGSKLVLSAAVCFFMQVAVIEIPLLSSLFKTSSLPFFAWLLVIFISALPIAVVEFEKKLLNKIKIHKKY